VPEAPTKMIRMVLLLIVLCMDLMLIFNLTCD